MVLFIDMLENTDDIVILYQFGIAVKVIEFWDYRGMRPRSEHSLLPDGSITEWHQDPEHGDWPAPVIMDKKRIDDLAEANPEWFSYSEVLGAPRERVEQILKQKKIKAKYIDPTMN